MTDTEKLAELLGKMVDFSDGTLYLMADYLIGKGVTFATDNNVSGKWVPVTERLPEIGVNILVCHKNGYVTRNAWLGTRWWFKNETNPVTHWMPMPQPPKEDK